MRRFEGDVVMLRRGSKFWSWVHFVDMVVCQLTNLTHLRDVHTHTHVSAIRIGRWLDKERNDILVSVEYDKMRANVAREMIHLAGLSSVIKVIQNDSASAIAELSRSNESFDLVFLDHHKDLYLRDLKLMEKTRLIRKGTILFADNVIFPGTPEYLKYVRSSPKKYDTKFYECELEYTSTSRRSANCPYKRVQDEIVRDGVEISTYLYDDDVDVDEEVVLGEKKAWGVFDDDSSSSSSSSEDEDDDDDNNNNQRFFLETCVFLENSCPNMEKIVDEKLKLCIRAAYIACKERDVLKVLNTTKNIRDECWSRIESASSSSSSSETLRSIVSEVSVTYAGAAAAMSKDLRDALRAVDEGLIFAPGEPGSLRRRMLRRVADILTEIIILPPKNNKTSIDKKYTTIPSVLCTTMIDKFNNDDISCLPSSTTVQEFITSITTTKNYDGIDSKTYRSVIVRNAKDVSMWPARKRWIDLADLSRRFGDRTIPVEIGNMMLKGKQKWCERLLTVRELVNDYLIPSNRGLISSDKVCYLAQHALFEQLPSLKDDFTPPRFCRLGVLRRTNAWLGTRDTVTPLHYDSYHNIFVQVGGVKVVKLIDPTSCHVDSLYVVGDKKGLHAQGNVSEVDVENPDYVRFPLFRKVNVLECVVYPGDILFIPKGWWHHVRSLSTSFSVNFWVDI